MARGGCVDESALLSSLTEDLIGGAAINHFIDEPLPDSSPFWELSNLIITPHIGWYSEQAMIDRQKKGAIIVREIFEGKQPKTILNPEVFSNI